MKKKKTKEFKITQEELEQYKFDFKKRGGKVKKLAEFEEVPIKRYVSGTLGRDLLG